MKALVQDILVLALAAACTYAALVAYTVHNLLAVACIALLLGLGVGLLIGWIIIKLRS